MTVMSSFAVPHFLILLAVLLVIAAILWLLISAIVSISKRSSASSTERVVWILICLLFAVIGPILWFTVGRKMSGEQPPARA